MSEYTRVNVYDYVCNSVLGEYADAYVSGVYEPVPSGFPSVCIRQIGRFTNEPNVTFSGVQGVRTSTFEAQVQTSKENSSMEEAEEIMDVVIRSFQELFYINTAVNPIENGDRGIYRLTATFRRVIGSADEMPAAQGTTGITGATGETT